MPTIGASNLKQIDGYKIRLIKLDELQSNLGVSTTVAGTYYASDAENTSSWVYQNFKNGDRSVSSYWTMTADPTYLSYFVRYVDMQGNVPYWFAWDYDNNYSGIRQVINLLKSSIE